jgi:predicted CXXCH cytochrome family protein
MSGNKLLLTALALFLIALSVRANESLPSSPSSPAADAQHSPLASSDYLGSAACARCHQEDYDRWEQSLHTRMTQPIAKAVILGDFTPGTRFAAHGRAFEVGRANGQPFITVTFGTAKPETFTVDYALGFKRFQGYLSKLPDGRMYVLPAFWHVESRRWIDWKEITPIPDGAHGLRQIWNTNCFNCHATNLSQGFNPATRSYDTTWTEMAIGCEACHGPGRTHVELMDAARLDPSLKPGGTLDIYSSSNGSPRQSFDSCAYCHGNKQNMFTGFNAGEAYADYALPFLISAPIPETDRQGEFWPDGRPNRFNRPQALMLSGCFKAGEVACTSCHVAHGSPNPFSLKVDVTRGRDGDTLCTQCHTAFGSQPSALGALGSQPSAFGSQLLALGPLSARPSADRSEPPSAESRPARAVDQHTFHAVDSEGSRCINCHMSDVNWRLLIRRRDHTFTAPVPELTAVFGVPNACTTCHDDRPPEWAAKQMDQWWDDAGRRRAALSLADTMYRAGSGDPSVLPELARLAIDRSQGAIVRASAVEFIERLALGTAGTANADAQSQTSFVRPPGTNAGAQPTSRTPVKLTHNQVNALIGAAADPEPVVRAHAVQALLASGARDRIIAPLTARLVDPARTVRARAAEALLVLGITHLPGAAGDALARAQDDFAQALTDFPDAASNHAELAWLEVSRDRIAEANRSLDMAIHLDPKSARPWVVKGVIAARAGDFAAAVSVWRRAKSLEPDYPRIDEMIAEAEKRK